MLSDHSGRHAVKRMAIGIGEAHMHTMDIEEALVFLTETFPFPGYFAPGLESHTTVAREIRARLAPGSRVLDLGCGPADKAAVLSCLGYHCTGFDDFNDPWHHEADNRTQIHAFAANVGVTLIERNGDTIPFENGAFDAVIVCDVIEHLHESPRTILSEALRTLRDGGHLLITVPNAANIRKRFHLLVGKTNYPPYDDLFSCNGPWRGHVREYVWDDLARLARHLALQDVEIRGCHHMLGVLPSWARPAYKALTAPLPGARDSLMLVARKPDGWVAPQT
jgi:SAM-dependent methyltransferase